MSTPENANKGEMNPVEKSLEWHENFLKDLGSAKDYIDMLEGEAKDTLTSLKRSGAEPGIRTEDEPAWKEVLAAIQVLANAKTFNHNTSRGQDGEYL